VWVVLSPEEVEKLIVLAADDQQHDKRRFFPQPSAADERC
jgi:hypothetical protein